MKLLFPSPEFDDAVAAVCHGASTEGEAKALNELLRSNRKALDEYLIRVELHNRLASDPDIFPQASEVPGPEESTSKLLRLEPLPEQGREVSLQGKKEPARGKPAMQILALAASVMLLAGGIWAVWFKRPSVREGTTSNAVAMLARTVDTRWSGMKVIPRVGSALQPGRLRLESGLAQIVFYSGARLIIEGPAELQLVSPMETVCMSGRVLAEVPPPARGFRVKTPQLSLVDRGTRFGVDANANRTEVHVFQGKVEIGNGSTAKQGLEAGHGALVKGNGVPQALPANPTAFASLFALEEKSVALDDDRYNEWRLTSARLKQDPTLIVHLDMEADSEWTLRNAAENSGAVLEASIIGCQRAEGRWSKKPALEFETMNDRVRLLLPGEFDSLTISTWVCVKGLDRQFNSLFMSDGFDPGTVHWLIRNDGVLGMTVFGIGPGNFQIMTSPPVVTLDKLGMWLHLAVVLDGKKRQAIQYLDGRVVSRHNLKLGPPFRIGAAELGNWNGRTGPKPSPELIRNLSGAVDEFQLFSRALSDAEIQQVYEHGKPDLIP